ncbi:hypothetical protein QQX98_007859 [Neonectria punicea]|uniref:Uncharacterized protein n=1 Tax=Neonectria punicea TaxID=979145 RepID=A0ABR1GWT4_9HYPO
MKFFINPDTLQTLVAKGRSLHKELKRAVAQRGQEYVALREIAPGYDIRLDSGRKPRLEQDNSLTKFLDNAGCPVTDHVFVEVINPGSDLAPPYQNYVHASGSDILCLMAASFSRAVKLHGGSTESLARVWRLTIENRDTRGLINDIMTRRKLKMGQITELDSHADDFFALLATDNGKGVARMLTAYPKMFGCKVIARARVYTMAVPAICWILEQVEGPEPNPQPEKTTPSRKEARHLRKASRSSKRSLD